MDLAFFKKVLDFTAQTGETVAFPAGSKTLVLLDLDKYQQMLADKRSIAHLTENELLGRINREIALWNQSQNSENVTIDTIPDIDTLKGIHFSAQNP